MFKDGETPKSYIQIMRPGKKKVEKKQEIQILLVDFLKQSKPKATSK